MGAQVKAIQELARALGSVNEMSLGITAATEEQTTNARQVSRAVENVNELTQSAASSAEEMSAATGQLSTMAQELQRLVGQFRIEGDGGNGNTQAIGNEPPESHPLIGAGDGPSALAGQRDREIS
jgi:hypothetical protein